MITVKTNLPSGLNNRPFPHTISLPAFFNLVLSGAVVDGRAGGLLLGHSYAEDGVAVVCQRGTDFFFHSVAEGGEFIINSDASCRNLRRLAAMEREAKSTGGTTMVEDPTAQVSSLVIATAEPNDRILWLDWNQVVVSGEATKRYLGELVTINQENNPYLHFNLDGSFPPEEPRTADGIV